MRCKRVHKLLSSYLEGELQERQRAKIGQHVSTCSACARVLDAMRVAVETLRNTRGKELPATFWLQVQAKLAAPEDHSRVPDVLLWWRSGWRAWQRKWVMAGALAVLASLTFNYYGTRHLQWETANLSDSTYVLLCEDQHAAYASYHPLTGSTFSALGSSLDE